MSISRQNFNNGSFKKRINSRMNHPVFKLLSKNSSQAFSVKEISRITRKKEDTVRSMLKKLIADGVAIHKAPYWALKVSNKKR